MRIMAASPTPIILLLLLLLLELTTTPTLSLLNPIDFLALQTIKKSMKDLNGSTFFTPWDFTSDPCSFPGVTCNGQGDHIHVIQLNLGEPRAGSPGLSGRIPPTIGNLTSLESLTLSPGQVFGTLPSSLSLLKNLKFLGLTRNYLTGPLPPLPLSSLQILDLSHNHFSGPLPSFPPSTPLVRLLLSHNHFTGPIPALSSPLSWLDLSHNSLTGDIKNKLPPTMEYLSLSWNNLTGAGGRELSRLRVLRYVDMSSNRFTGVVPGDVFGLPLLNRLELRGNGFYGEVLPLKIVGVGMVDLSFNGLWGEVSPLFYGVVELYLSNNRFSGRVPWPIVQGVVNRGILVLYLQHNYLTGLDFDPSSSSSAAANLSSIPASVSVCLLYNCMVPPPVAITCPPHAGTIVSRPLSQCPTATQSP